MNQKQTVNSRNIGMITLGKRPYMTGWRQYGGHYSDLLYVHYKTRVYFTSASRELKNDLSFPNDFQFLRVNADF